MKPGTVSSLRSQIASWLQGLREILYSSCSKSWEFLSTKFSSFYETLLIRAHKYQLKRQKHNETNHAINSDNQPQQSDSFESTDAVQGEAQEHVSRSEQQSTRRGKKPALVRALRLLLKRINVPTQLIKSVFDLRDTCSYCNTSLYLLATIDHHGTLPARKQKFRESRNRPTGTATFRRGKAS